MYENMHNAPINMSPMHTLYLTYSAMRRSGLITKATTKAKKAGINKKAFIFLRWLTAERGYG